MVVTGGGKDVGGVGDGVKDTDGTGLTFGVDTGAVVFEGIEALLEGVIELGAGLSVAGAAQAASDTNKQRLRSNMVTICDFLKIMSISLNHFSWKTISKAGYLPIASNLLQSPLFSPIARNIYGLSVIDILPCCVG